MNDLEGHRTYSEEDIVRKIEERAQKEKRAEERTERAKDMLRNRVNLNQEEREVGMAY